MPPQKNPLKIYKLLPQTNCGECYLPSCLAFAAAVVRGDKKLTDCPYVDAGPDHDMTQDVVEREPYEIMRGEDLAKLQHKVKDLELAGLADRLGARMVGEKLAVTCLGKDFFMDSHGTVTSECHTHCGLTIPLLSYIVFSRGDEITGNWVPFRELKGAPPMNALFEQRGERRLQKLADSHTDLFDDLIGIFCGISAENMFSSDISVVLNPLPRLPILICYWKPEDDLGSKLNIFFDTSADRHLKIEAIFELTIGMVMMFEKIALKHS